MVHTHWTMTSGLAFSSLGSLSLKDIYKGGDDTAYATFKKLRWLETDGEPVCPHCGGLKPYDIATRRRFKCRACGKQFSVTSGTIFASRKLAFTDLCAAICIFVNTAKGLSRVQLSRDLDVQYKTAFVLAHKIREALAYETAGMTLDGEVEIDGAYVGGKVRAEDRNDRRLKQNQSDRRRVVGMRERGGRTLTFVAKREAEGVELARRHIDPASSVFADEAGHWDELHAIFPNTGRINHSMAYADGDDHTNWIESYFSRLRRMIDGQHHHVRPATSISTPIRRHGLKITAASRTARCSHAHSGLR